MLAFDKVFIIVGLMVVFGINIKYYWYLADCVNNEFLWCRIQIWLSVFREFQTQIILFCYHCVVKMLTQFGVVNAARFFSPKHVSMDNLDWTVYTHAIVWTMLRVTERMESVPTACVPLGGKDKAVT